MEPVHVLVLILWINSISISCTMGSLVPVKNKGPRQSQSRASDFHLKLRGRQRKDEIRRKVCMYIETCKINRKEYFDDPDVTVKPVIPPTFRRMNPNLPNNLDADPLFSVPDEAANDTKCMGFDIPSKYFQKDINIRGIDAYVFIKVKKKRKQLRKITLKVTSLGNNITTRRQVARLKFRPTETKWYKISLPISVLRKLRKTTQKTLPLCIQCKKCNRRIQITFPIKEKKQKRYMQISRKKNKKKKASRKKFLRQNRPFLICRMKEKDSRRNKRHLRKCDSNSSDSKCCRVDSFLTFRELGIGNEVVSPSGLRLSRCEGACIRANTSYATNDRSITKQCEIKKSQPLNIFVVFKNKIGYISLRNGDIKSCACTTINQSN